MDWNAVELLAAGAVIGIFFAKVAKDIVPDRKVFTVLNTIYLAAIVMLLFVVWRLIQLMGNPDPRAVNIGAITLAIIAVFALMTVMLLSLIHQVTKRVAVIEKHVGLSPSQQKT